MANYTPMMQQYLKIKAQQKDAFLFFRLGDFYELFFDDATRAAQELEITLTSREGGEDGRIPMCGVPYHSAANYIKNLVEKGYKVAICEQVEDPKEAKGVVRREVVQLVTPGTVMDGVMLDEEENNYLASLTPFDDGTFVIAYNDLTTGENSVAMLTDGFDGVLSELFNRPVKEIVVPTDLDAEYQTSLQERLGVTISKEDRTEITEGYQSLVQNLHQDKLKIGFGRLFYYIQETQKRSMDHLKEVQYIELNQFMKLDMYSKRNLELMETIRKQGKKGSLLWVLDHTVTSMGSRMLKKWVERPLLKRQLIEDRYNQVEGFLEQFFERETLREALQSVYDLERLAGRVSYGNVNARDLIQLKHSIGKIPEIKSILQSFSQPELKELGEQLHPLQDVYQLLDESIYDDPPITIKEGGLIKDGFNNQLDDYRDAARNGKQWIAELERKEREATNIKSLKVGYNRVFGYYIEVTKANLHHLPEGRYERKQTLTNAERYITPDLKEKESLILEAQEKSVELEYDMFIKVREQVKEYIPSLQHLAEQICSIDVLQGFATVSEHNQYARPELVDNRDIYIEQGRHPVVEKVMKEDTFVPNDVNMQDESDILLITGPNMSGKSTYMRQLALTAVMAQIGCFVPCSYARLPIFDQIFTRIGAADDLVSGQSTFMVEMMEAKHALTKATDRSLILLDEIGRGTSTYDGMALAQAIVEYIHGNIGAKTLFSTHYHELTELEKSLNHLTNVHVRAEEYEGKVVFLHQIQKGAADESYGIHVAKLAELPEPLIERANAILKQLEGSSEVNETPLYGHEDDHQLTLFEPKEKPVQVETESKSTREETKVIEQLKDLDLLELNPIEAMNHLYQLQKQLKK
ncbi:DNA mismatch repair protein MutS [Pontibacillus yanchengensis]|uniref:DNA mismatch repair protein MutS n=2 Tax=Pontibacillus yanchengensis TaxID=462910 RepID=A0A6I4ZSN8_9BACI|nr:DNA mismatch repair protein MutS [Pontibacillus yanchengensis]MYL33228.1 DNA mismatch repair protein MutS [Pontibacillus yanchengensis]MYL51922.1 DNA mismatch repair protein MutS [Pontibacillus yanchengensis]